MLLAGALFNWVPRDVTKAKAIMQYNLATAHAIRGEYEKAIMNLAKVSFIVKEISCFRINELSLAHVNPFSALSL
jgi:hypothetical protein